MGYLDTIYRKLPVPLQNVAVSAFGVYWNRVRFSGKFKSEVEAFHNRERWSREQWRQYQEKTLQKLLILAFTRVPYYKETWRGLLTIPQLQNFKLSDLQYLPPLEKQAIRDDPLAFLVDGKPQKKHMIQHTSGSTGTPIAVYWLSEELQRSLALRESRSCGFAGVSYKMPRATFSGRIVVPNPESKGPYHRYNFVERQVYFSAFHLGPNSVEQYITALKRHRTSWLNGYSNSIYQLAQLALDQGLDIPPIKAVITTSEKMTTEMRRIVEKAFTTRVYEEYGTVEDCFYVCENEYGEKLVNPDAGILEVVDDQFQTVPAGVEGEVLATGFVRPNQPFIRYRIGDIAVMREEPSQCGREMPVMQEVIGRVEDTIYGSDGRRMVRFHGIFVNQPNVYEAQIIQKTLDHIHVRVVPKQGFGSDDKQDIIHRVQQRLTDKVYVSIEIVSHIERTSAGKFKAVVSELPTNEQQKMCQESH